MPSNSSAYMSAHRNLYRKRGRADAHLCECGRQARDWAYIGHDPERFSQRVEDYKPMCRSCHAKLDGVGKALLTPEARARSNEVRQPRPIEELAEIGRKGGVTTAQQPEHLSRTLHQVRVCSCGLASNAGGIGTHQKATGHRGAS